MIILLQNSDHPGMNLISSLLTGNNYLTWSRSVKIALGAKTKLGFIDRKCKPPDEKDAKYIVEAFLYVNIAKDSWDEFKERFGEWNDPLLYQI